MLPFLHTATNASPAPPSPQLFQIPSPSFTFFLFFLCFTQDCISFQDTDLLQTRDLPSLDPYSLHIPPLPSVCYKFSPAAPDLKKEVSAGEQHPRFSLYTFIKLRDEMAPLKRAPNVYTNLAAQLQARLFHPQLWCCSLEGAIPQDAGQLPAAMLRQCCQQSVAPYLQRHHHLNCETGSWI